MKPRTFVSYVPLVLGLGATLWAQSPTDAPSDPAKRNPVSPAVQTGSQAAATRQTVAPKRSVSVPDGTWKGTTSDGNELSFSITNYQLTDARSIPLAFGCEPNVSFTIFSGSLAKDDVTAERNMVSRSTGAFTIIDFSTSRLGPGTIRITATGRILPDMSASGTIVYRGPCTVRKTWKASRVTAE